MSLEKQIQEDMKAFMKAKEKAKLEAIRAVKAAILLAKTEKGGNEDLTEEQEMKLLQKLVKQRRDSSEMYKENGRDELAEKEALEAEVIAKYLPQPLSAEELEAELKAIIEEAGASTPKDMGKVMGLASKKLAGKADGKAISTKVKELLS